MKKTIVFDFDGVIHSYKSGWKSPTIISDEPVNGIKETIDNLRQDYKVVIVSTRCFQNGGIAAIKEWLCKYDIIVDDVMGEKPPAAVYVDDRAICFDGDTKYLAEKIKSFKNWIEINKSNQEIQNNDNEKILYQIDMAQKYIDDYRKQHDNVSEPTEEYCIISNLLRIIKNK